MSSINCASFLTAALLAVHLLTGCAEDDSDQRAPTEAMIAAALASTDCVSGGATAADAAIAAQVRPQMNGVRLGHSINAYNVSCARSIINATRNRGLASRAAVIAITTAITESSLHNYTEAADHDSLGLFQQRPSQGWGTPAQIINPTYATNAFLSAMLTKFPNNSWMSGEIGPICQRVQVSAFPDAYRHEVHDAQLLVDALGAGGLGVLDFFLSDDPRSGVNTRAVIHYGNSPMVPIVGDWDGDGIDTVSAYDPTSGRFYLSNDPATGAHQYTFLYGNPGAVPLVGDWDGDGKDNVGVRMGNTFCLRMSAVTDAAEITSTVAYGDAPDVPLVGDWDGDGKDNVGVYKPQLGRFYVRMTANSNPTETTISLPYGNANATPLVGDWNNDGKDNIGVRMGNVYYFRTGEVTASAEITASVAYGNGDGNELPIIGDWNGDGIDTQGIVY
jgi:hypothetical protein